MTKSIKDTVLSLRSVVTRRDTFRLEIDALTVGKGEIHCIVGPNGCGKTTLFDTVLGLVPHVGVCLFNNKPYEDTNPAQKAAIGFVPDDPDLLFEELTATEQWAVTASVIASARHHRDAAGLRQYAAALAARLSFTPPPQTLRTYSHGMRKKTQLVDALIGKPDLIILDELHNGLDPIAIEQAERLLREEVSRGAAILAATHDLWWAERFADYVYVMNRGRICAAGTVQQLRKKQESNLAAAFTRIIEADS